MRCGNFFRFKVKMCMISEKKPKKNTSGLFSERHFQEDEMYEYMYVSFEEKFN